MKTTKVNKTQNSYSYPTKSKKNQLKDLQFAQPICKNPFFHNQTKVNLTKKITFSEKEKSKQLLKEKFKDVFQELDLLFDKYEELAIWKDKFSELMRNHINILDLLPVSLNEKGSMIQETMKFWVLFIKFKEETLNINIQESISLFNNAYSYDFESKSYEFLNTFYLNFINTKFSKVEIFNQLSKSKNKFNHPLKPQNVEIYHYKYLIDYPEFFVISEFDKKINSIDDSSLISPSNFSSKCSSLNNSVISTLAGKYPMNFEKISNQTIYFNSQINLFSANHSFNNSFIKRRLHSKKINKYRDNELTFSLANKIEIKENSDYIRRFDSLAISKDTENISIDEYRECKTDITFSLKSDKILYEFAPIIIEKKYLEEFKSPFKKCKTEEKSEKKKRSKNENFEEKNKTINFPLKKKTNDNLFLGKKFIVREFKNSFKNDNKKNSCKIEKNIKIKKDEKKKKKNVFNNVNYVDYNYFSVRTRSQSRNIKLLNSN